MNNTREMLAIQAEKAIDNCQSFDELQHLHESLLGHKVPDSFSKFQKFKNLGANRFVGRIKRKQTNLLNLDLNQSCEQFFQRQGYL